MYKIKREYIERTLDSAGFNPETVIRDDYSGRYMYGATCFGLVLDGQSDLGSVMFEFGSLYQELTQESIETPWEGDSEDLEAIYQLSHVYRIDSMGLGTIIYFPNIELIG